MVQDIERDETKFQFSDTEDDVFSVAGVLKQCKLMAAKRTKLMIDLRELPDPVFPLPHAERVKHTKERGTRTRVQGIGLMTETHIHSNFSALRGRLRRLPPIHQTTFRALIEHLGRVNSHSTQNKMDAKVSVILMGEGEIEADNQNLAVIFSEMDPADQPRKQADV